MGDVDTSETRCPNCGQPVTSFRFALLVGHGWEDYCSKACGRSHLSLGIPYIEDMGDGIVLLGVKSAS